MGYQRAVLYFYTGTGNSYCVANWLVGAAETSGASVTLRSIESASPEDEIGLGD